MEGFWFLWVLWLLIIAFLFFDENKKRKGKWIKICIVLIISSIIIVPIFAISIRLSFIFFAYLVFYYLKQRAKGEIIYSYLISSLLSGVFILFHYFVYFEPVWLYVSPTITVNVLTLVTVIVLVNNHFRRLTIMAAGMVQGEILLAILMHQHSHPTFETYIVGNYNFLDLLFLAIFMILCWNGLEILMTNIKTKWYQRRFPTNNTHSKVNA